MTKKLINILDKIDTTLHLQNDNQTTVVVNRDDLIELYYAISELLVNVCYNELQPPTKVASIQLKIAETWLASNLDADEDHVFTTGVFFETPLHYAFSEANARDAIDLNNEVMNWTIINQNDPTTWPPNDIDVWLRDEDGNAKVALCTPLPSMGKVHCVFTGCVDNTQVLKWATHWSPAVPPEFE